MPDIILMDICMPDCNGLEATREIKHQLPYVRIIILTVSDTDEDLFEAIKNGAQGFLQKDLEQGELGGLLRRAASGEALLSGLLAAKVLSEYRKPNVDPDLPIREPITGREIEILKHVAGGKTNREIAEILCITENTVKNHLSNILEKLQMNNRVQLAVYAVREGLIN